MLASLLVATALVSATYGDRLAEAAAFEVSGNIEGARAALAAAAAQYPQDYALALRLGWLCYRDGDLDAADRQFARAHALSRGSAESVSALAVVRSSRAAKAEAWFGVTTRVGSEVDGGAAFVGMLARPFEPVVLSASYRGLLLFGDETSAQHEIFTSIGLELDRVRLRAHYGWVNTEDEAYGAHVLGLSSRFAPSTSLGTIDLDATVSLYGDDTIVGQLGGQWRIPIIGGLSLVPGAALQLTDGGTYGHGTLALSYAGAWGSITAGGKAGDAYRPVDLDTATIWNLDETIRWGASAEGLLAITDDTAIFANWSMDHLVDSTSGDERDLHHLTVGLTYQF